MLSTRPSDDELFMEQAHVAARRSLCDRDQVGAVIVSLHKIVISTGRNGPPYGFNHQDRTCTDWCPRAALADWHANSHGEDMPAVAQTVFTDHQTLHTDYSDCFTIHAEANALLTSNRDQRTGGTIYVTSDPCWSCAKMIANSGLRTLVVETNERKADERQAIKTYEFLESVGLDVIFLTRKGQDDAGTP